MISGIESTILARLKSGPIHPALVRGAALVWRRLALRPIRGTCTEVERQRDRHANLRLFMRFDWRPEYSPSPQSSVISVPGWLYAGSIVTSEHGALKL
jgi:hypothetical protein